MIFIEFETLLEPKVPATVNLMNRKIIVHLNFLIVM
jgi:hypothetical protein